MKSRTFANRYLIVTLICVCFSTFFKTTTALVSQSDFLPFTESSGATHFYFEDFRVTSFHLTQRFLFLGVLRSYVYISGDGRITFGGSGEIRYHCNPNPTAATVPTIAVYMADADNRLDPSGAKLLYREDTSSSSLAKVSRDVFTAFPQLRGRVALNWALSVTWYNIPPYYDYGSASQRNTYQAVLTTDGVHSFVLLYYNKVEWPSNRMTAEAGIYGGPNNNQNSYVIPNSCSREVINIPTMSNINSPGKFVFRVDYSLQLPRLSSRSSSPCVPQIKPMAPIQFQPAFVPAIGSVPLLVRGLDLCFNPIVAASKCTFHDSSRQRPVVVEVSILPNQVGLICPTPPEFYSVGRTRVDISVAFATGDNFTTHGYVDVIPPQSQVNLHLHTRESSNGSRQLEASWPTNIIGEMKEIEDFYNETLQGDFSRFKTDTTNLSFTLMELSGNFWVELHSFGNILNNGSWSLELPQHVKRRLLSDDSPPRTMKISKTIGLLNGASLKTEQVADITETTYMLAKLKSSAQANQSNSLDQKCKDWYDNEPSPPTDTLPCPVTMQQALADWRFSRKSQKIQVINPLNFTVFLQNDPSPSGASSQCSYDTRGKLVICHPHGSRLHRRSPNNQNDPWSHYWEDVLPHLHCCHLSHFKNDNCKNYFFAKRPSSDGSGYHFPQPFRATGAGHISTFNGVPYLMNTIGTFWLLKYPGELEIQILLEKFSNSTATVITTAVISTTENGTRTNIQVSALSATKFPRIHYSAGNKPTNFYQRHVIDEDGTSGVLFTFSSGFSVKFTLASGRSPFLNIIGSASQNIVGELNGLLENYNGTLARISKEFVEQWRVPQHQSLFTFPNGKTWSDYNNLSNFQTFRSSSEDQVIANASAAANFQYELLLKASKTVVMPIACGPPPIFSHGGFLGNSSNLGAPISLYCDDGYIPHVNGKADADLSQGHANFTCVTDEYLPQEDFDQEAKWISTKSSRPISNYSFECVPFTTQAVVPEVVSILGSTPLYITLPHRLDRNNLVGVTCTFSSAITSARIKTEGEIVYVLTQTSKIMCPVPVLQTLGKTRVRIELHYLRRLTLLFEDQFWVQKPEDFGSESENGIDMCWNSTNFDNDLCNELATNNNAIVATVDLPRSPIRNSGGYIELVPMPHIIQPNRGNMKIHNLPTTALKARTVREISSDTQPETLASFDLFSAMMAAYKTMTVGNGDIREHLVTQLGTNNDTDYFSLACQQWYDQENIHLLATDSIPCPESVSQAHVDWRFTPDTSQILAHFGSTVFVQSVPSVSKSGSQCAYDDNGRLMSGSPSGSRVHRFNPNGWDNYWSHFTHDTLPYLYCCKWSNNPSYTCSALFYEKRGMNPSRTYSPPKLAHVGGVTQFHTFDGAQYRFNGAGEFWLIKYENRRWSHLNKFYGQARLEPFIKAGASNNESSGVTVMTAMTMHQTLQGHPVTVQVSRNATSTDGFDILLDGEQVDTDKLTTLYHDGAIIFFNRTASLELLVVFQTGFSFKFTMAGVNDAGMNVIFSAGQNLMTKTVGLLGAYDGDLTNDFQTPSGTVIPRNSTFSKIHHDFGMRWIVPENESLFSYQPYGTSYAQYYKPDMEPIEFLPMTHVIQLVGAQVFGLLGKSPEYVFNMLTTGSEAFAEAAMESYNEFKAMVDTLATA